MGAEQSSQAASKWLEVYKRADGKHAWRLVINGEVIATDGGQGYESVTQATQMGMKIINGHYYAAQLRVS
jgi:uncharacterized protein YegP (UPF0339 family)